jgi:hypothetical protein
MDEGCLNGYLTVWWHCFGGNLKLIPSKMKQPQVDSVQNETIINMAHMRLRFWCDSITHQDLGLKVKVNAYSLISMEFALARAYEIMWLL